MLGKAAHGIADDLLTSILIARSGSTVFVPSMNAGMWANPAVRRNVERLRGDGHRFVLRDAAGPALETATGEWVMTDLMPDPPAVARQIAAFAAGPAPGVH
jgi:phosphopantothenoylcysteine decarboxylase/phosphopantothenate--cysteine ligase